MSDLFSKNQHLCLVACVNESVSTISDIVVPKIEKKIKFISNTLVSIINENTEINNNDYISQIQLITNDMFMSDVQKKLALTKVTTALRQSVEQSQQLPRHTDEIPPRDTNFFYTVSDSPIFGNFLFYFILFFYCFSFFVFIFENTFAKICMFLFCFVFPYFKKKNLKEDR